MCRFINVLLMLLVVVAFFFGVTTGKAIQTIDTPVKKEIKVQSITVIPSIQLTRFTVPLCNFSFTAPSTMHVIVSSQSAALTEGSQSLELVCGKNKKNITASGSSTLLNSVRQGFDASFSIQSSGY